VQSLTPAAAARPRWRPPRRRPAFERSTCAISRTANVPARSPLIAAAACAPSRSWSRTRRGTPPRRQSPALGQRRRTSSAPRSLPSARHPPPRRGSPDCTSSRMAPRLVIASRSCSMKQSARTWRRGLYRSPNASDLTPPLAANMVYKAFLNLTLAGGHYG